jgi:hypothetical protein
MPQTFEHLHTGVWSFLDESQEQRITRLYMPKWVSYARANEALARMEHLVRHPPCGRMPSMLLYGDSDIGKTMIVDKFVRDHPDICNEHGEVEARRVLRLQMPSKPNDDKLYAQIIQGLGHQAPYSRRGTDLEILGLRLSHRHPPKLMIVDEVHHLLAGSVREQRQSLNQLKFLSNELRMPVVALGTSEALYAMQTDPQIASRFEPYALPRWRESAGLREFVVSFGRLLPLHLPSPFGEKDVIQKLMAFSGGLTGRITTLLTQAAELAIRQKTESISLALIQQAAAAGIFKIPVEHEPDLADA